VYTSYTIAHDAVSGTRRRSTQRANFGPPTPANPARLFCVHCVFDCDTERILIVVSPPVKHFSLSASLPNTFNPAFRGCQNPINGLFVYLSEFISHYLCRSLRSSNTNFLTRPAVLLATFHLGPFLCLHLLLGTLYLHTFVLSIPYPHLKAT